MSGARTAAAVLSLVERLDRVSQHSRVQAQALRQDLAPRVQALEARPSPRAGRGIDRVYVDPAGDLIVVYDDGQRQNAGRVRSRDTVVMGGGGARSTAADRPRYTQALAGHSVLIPVAVHRLPSPSRLTVHRPDGAAVSVAWQTGPGGDVRLESLVALDGHTAYLE